MQELLSWAETVLRVVLAGAFALAPGLAVWLLALGAFLILRRLVRSDLLQELRPRSGNIR